MTESAMFVQFDGSRIFGVTYHGDHFPEAPEVALSNERGQKLPCLRLICGIPDEHKLSLPPCSDKPFLGGTDRRRGKSQDLMFQLCD